jgi:hypothetical protein
MRFKSNDEPADSLKLPAFHEDNRITNEAALALLMRHDGLT